MTRSTCRRTRRSSSRSRSRSRTRSRSSATTRRFFSSRATRRPGRRPLRGQSTSDPSADNIQLELEDFTIKFDMSSPIRWSNPQGESPALYDPENNPYGIQHAVIDTSDSNLNYNMTVLTLDNHGRERSTSVRRCVVRGAPGQLAQSGDTTHQYVGEQDIDLIRANDRDNGTISNSDFPGRLDRDCSAGPGTSPITR